MSKKSYWVINEYLNPEWLGFNECYFNCPVCKATTIIVLNERLPLPNPKYCQYCGKRLYIKENER